MIPGPGIEKPDLEFVLGGNEPIKEASANGSRLHILYDGQDLTKDGLHITKSAKLAKFLNGVSWVWTKLSNCLPGRRKSERRKYVPLELTNHQIVYVNINSIMKRLLDMHGSIRDRTLSGAMRQNRDIYQTVKGTSTRSHKRQAHAIKTLIQWAASEEIRLARVQKYWKPESISEGTLRQIQLRDPKYNPYTAPFYKFEDHVQREEYWILAERRMALSTTVTGRSLSVYKQAMQNWEHADLLIAQWAKQDRAEALKALSFSKKDPQAYQVARELHRKKIEQNLSEMLGLTIGRGGETRENINAIIGEGLAHNGGTPGTIRGHYSEVSTIDKYYIAGRHVQPEMESFVKWLSEKLSTHDEYPGQKALHIAAQAYQRLVSIHPYADGNGRTARMLLDYILQRYGLPPAALPVRGVAVFGDGPKEITTEQLFMHIRKGVVKSCKILGLDHPFNRSYDEVFGQEVQKEKVKEQTEEDL